MALKRQQEMLATFSMASMTDVVFLLLVFFMVTSAFVFPTALEIDLPQSTRQTPLKPAVRLYIDAAGDYYIAREQEQPAPVEKDSLTSALRAAIAPDTAAVAVYADAEVQYGKVVEVLNAGAANDVKMVLATRPATVDDNGGGNPGANSGEQP